MGIQLKEDVTLIRHAYVRTAKRNSGIGGKLLAHLRSMAAVRTVRDKYIADQKPPTTTLVQLDKLFRPDILIEIEATAIIPNKKK